MKKWLIPTLAALVLVSCQERSGVYEGKLSSLKESGAFLGAGWTGPKGLVIDDVNDVSSLEGAERVVAEGLVRMLAPHGVVSCADFTYHGRNLGIITLRVFVFDSADSARRWWKTKHEGAGWEKSYEKVEGVGEKALDAKELPKRIVLQGKVLFTCHQLHQGDEYLKVLHRYMSKMGAG